MVDVVTEQAAQAQHADAAQAADTTAAEEMARAAQEAAVQDTTAEEETSSSEAKEWEDLLVEESDDETPEVKPVETPAEADDETPPVETPDEVTPPEETPPVDEVVLAVEETPPEVEVPPVEETPADTRTPEEVTAEVTKARETARGKLVESFKWTEEQTEQFEDDPGKVMSEMAANLFLDLYDSISQGLNSQMPGMVQGIMRHQDAVRANEQKFFGAWPQLADPKYRETVDRISNAYRQQNPTTDEATAVKEIGAQAWVALRLPLDELMAHTQDAPVTSPPVITKPGHVPASAGSAPQSAHTPPAASANEYEQLATELLLDDDG